MKFRTYIIAIAIVIIFNAFIIVIANLNTEERPNQVEECEHEWVVTSEFSLLSKTHYRTVSKCIKCGKVIR